jgi:hypothetical protein
LESEFGWGEATWREENWRDGNWRAGRHVLLQLRYRYSLS